MPDNDFMTQDQWDALKLDEHDTLSKFLGRGVDDLTLAEIQENYYFVVQQESGTWLKHRSEGKFSIEHKIFNSSEEYYQWRKLYDLHELMLSDTNLQSIFSDAATGKTDDNFAKLQTLLESWSDPDTTDVQLKVDSNNEKIFDTASGMKSVNDLLPESWFEEESHKILHESLLAQFRDPGNTKQRRVLFEEVGERELIVFIPNRTNPTLHRFGINVAENADGEVVLGKHLLAESLKTIKCDPVVNFLWRSGHTMNSPRQFGNHNTISDERANINDVLDLVKKFN